MKCHHTFSKYDLELLDRWFAWNAKPYFLWKVFPHTPNQKKKNPNIICCSCNFHFNGLIYIYIFRICSQRDLIWRKANRESPKLSSLYKIDPIGPFCSILMLSLVNMVKTLIIIYGIYAYNFAKTNVSYSHSCELDIVLSRKVNILTTNELVS